MEKLIELDSQIYAIQQIEFQGGISGELLGKKESIRNDKKKLAEEGLFYIAYLHHLTSANIDKFDKLKRRKKPEEIDRQCEYFERMLLDHYRDKEFVNDEEFYNFLRKEKKIDIRAEIESFRDSKKKLFSAQGGNSINRMIPIHGDCGAHHITLDGIFFDFDEFRLDLPQDDIVRFLNSEFVCAYTPLTEHEIISSLADYFVDRKRFEGKIAWDDKFKKSRAELLAPYKRDFENFVRLYYCERLDENIHLYAINKKFESQGESHRLKQLSQGHPTLRSAEDFKRYRTEDIKNMLSFLLETKYGRENILRDPDSNATTYFEEMRTFLERSGIYIADGHKEKEDPNALYL